MTTGSRARWGWAPWPETPRITASSEWDPAERIPGREPMVPAGRTGSAWRARPQAGTGNRVKSPSRIMARAPAPVSSAGWATKRSVPDQAQSSRASRQAVPAKTAMCRSWLQACITGTVNPPDTAMSVEA